MVSCENILFKKDLVDLKDGEFVSGLALMGTYIEKPTKNGSSFLSGSLDASGNIPFKVWRGSCYNKMISESLVGKICSITGKVSLYGGMFSLELNDIEEIPETTLDELKVKVTDFLESKINVDEYWNQLVSLLGKNVSEEAMQVFNTVMSEDVVTRFKEEFAASSHHDNFKGGLLAHTTKVTMLAKVVKMYPNILKRVDPDLLFIGCALHDIGKIEEYSLGVMSDIGLRVSHLAVGIFMVDKHKDKIVELKGNEFYLSLLSIISQHHGEFGEMPRTLGAYVVHMLDNLDSQLSLLDQVLETSESQQIVFKDMKLI